MSHRLINLEPSGEAGLPFFSLTGQSAVPMAACQSEQGTSHRPGGVSSDPHRLAASLSGHYLHRPVTRWSQSAKRRRTSRAPPVREQMGRGVGLGGGQEVPDGAKGKNK